MLWKGDREEEEEVTMKPASEKRSKRKVDWGFGWYGKMEGLRYCMITRF